jgi:hypothetical protein
VPLLPFGGFFKSHPKKQKYCSAYPGLVIWAQIKLHFALAMRPALVAKSTVKDLGYAAN